MQVATAGTTAAMKLTAGLSGYVGAGSLISSNLVGQSIAALGLGAQTYRDMKAVSAKVSWERIVVLARRYRKFPLTDSWSGLLNSLSIQLPTMLLAMFFSQSVVGYYALGTRVIQLPMALIGSAIAQVFFQRASEARHENQLAPVVQATYKRLVGLGLYPIAVLGIVGQEAFTIIFGAQWSEAGVYAQIVSPWRLFVFVGSPMSTLFGVLERQETFLSFNIALLLVRVLSLSVGGKTGNARLTLALYALSGLVFWIWLVLWVVRSSGASTRQAVLDSGRYLLYAAPILLVLAAAKWWWSWTAWALLILSGSGALVYYGVVIWKDPSLRDLARAIPARLRRKGA